MLKRLSARCAFCGLEPLQRCESFEQRLQQVKTKQFFVFELLSKQRSCCDEMHEKQNKMELERFGLAAKAWITLY